MSNINVNNLTPLSGTGGKVSISGSLHVSGNLTANGTLTLGDTNTDNISFNAEITSSIVPDLDNKFDLGSSNKEWKDLYIDGTANIDILGTSADPIGTASFANISSSLIPGVNNQNSLGSGTRKWAIIHGMSGSFLNITSTNITASDVVQIGGHPFSTKGKLRVGSHATDNGGLTQIDRGNITASGFNNNGGHISASGTIFAKSLSLAGGTTINSTSITAVSGNFSYISSSSPTVFAGDINPDNDSTSNVGSIQKRWAALNVDSASIQHLYGHSVIGNSTINVSGNLSPLSVNDDKFDLGASSAQWRNLYIDRVGYIDSLGATAHDTQIAYIQQLSGSGASPNVSCSVNLVPGLDNTYSLGDAGKEWKDLFIDGTAHIDTLTADTITNVNTINITASGNISGSATSTLTIGGALTAGASTLTILNASSHITSSGNISSSALITANAFTGSSFGGGNFSGTALNVNNLTASVATITLGTVTILNSTTSNITSVVSTDITASGVISASGYIVTQNITASGNISASALITANAFTGSNFGGGNFVGSIFNANQYRISNSRFAVPGINANNFIIGDDVANAKSLTLLHITASGNITASSVFVSTNLTSPLANLTTLTSISGSFTNINSTNISASNTLIVGEPNGGIPPNNHTIITGSVISGSSIAVHAGSLNLKKAVGPSVDSATYTSPILTGIPANKFEMRNQLQAQLDDGTFAAFRLHNTSIATDSIIMGTFTGGTAGAITASILSINTIAASSASFRIHNETGVNVANNAGFTASFVVL